MTAVATEARTITIDLERDCLDNDCAALADRFLAQLGVPKYSLGASVMEVPPTVEAWRAAHRTARKRADRAARLGYGFHELRDRQPYAADIFAVNTSAPTRQGRPMSAGYLRPLNYSPLPDYACYRHRVETFGVLLDTTLVAYLSTYSVGQLRLVSMILGHAAHLDAGIMYLMYQGYIERHAGEDAVVFYNRHDSGESGLAWMKERLGFRAGDIEWTL